MLQRQCANKMHSLPQGALGAEPSPAGQAFTFTVTTQGQLANPEAFERIILKTDEHGGILRLGDVARAELGSQSYAFSAMYNGRPAVPMAIYLQPGANAVDTGAAVRKTLENLSAGFPEGLEYSIAYSTTEFVEISIREVLSPW
jgi:multidrug efflux pump